MRTVPSLPMMPTRSRLPCLLLTLALPACASHASSSSSASNSPSDGKPQDAGGEGGGSGDAASASQDATESEGSGILQDDSSVRSDVGSDSAASATCGAGDSNLPAEPTIPPACATLQALQAVAAGALPSESNLDTSRIQSALAACASGQAVKLVTNGADNAFITTPLTVPSGVSLWVDSGVTLYGSRDPTKYGSPSCGGTSGSCPALITVKGANSGIVGEGVIDGQGGELLVGQTQSWWDVSDSLQSSGGSAANPTLIEVEGATNFTLYKITLHNSPKFHVVLGAAGFVVWGVTIKTPSTATNSQGTAALHADHRSQHRRDRPGGIGEQRLHRLQQDQRRRRPDCDQRRNFHRSSDHRAQPFRRRPRHVHRQRDERRRGERERLRPVD